jgi:hypothetical protein
MSERRNDLEITNEIPQNCFCRSQTRINLLFTMSEITHVTIHPDSACEVMFRGRYIWRSAVRPVFALRATPGTLRFVSFVAAPRVAEGEAWWSQTGSNRRPHACKARALPAELWPRTRRRMRLIARHARSPSLALRRSSLRSRKACRAEAA